MLNVVHNNISASLGIILGSSYRRFGVCFHQKKNSFWMATSWFDFIELGDHLISIWLVVLFRVEFPVERSSHLFQHPLVDLGALPKR